MAQEQWRSDGRYYLNADRSRIVEESDPDAAYLYTTPGRLVPLDEAIRYGLAGKQDAAKTEVPADMEDDQGEKAVKPEEDKAVAPQEDKAVKPEEDKSLGDVKPIQDEDDVTAINGIGPGLAKKLESINVRTVADFRKASDRDVLDLGGVSPAKLREFRDQVG